MIRNEVIRDKMGVTYVADKMEEAGKVRACEEVCGYASKEL